MNLIECNVLVGDRKLSEMGIDNPETWEWVRGSFVLESVVGHFATLAMNDAPAITLHLVGGHTMTVDMESEDFINLYKAGMEIADDDV